MQLYLKADITQVEHRQQMPLVECSGHYRQLHAQAWSGTVSCRLLDKMRMSCQHVDVAQAVHHR